eukprot:g22318.t1
MSDLWAVLCGLLVFALMMGILWVDFRRLGRSLGILGKATELDVERWIQNQLPCVHTDGELMCAICLDQLQFDERASNIGTEHFVGQAGAAAEGGLAVAIYEWSAGLLIYFLGFGLAPLYLGLDLTTTPQWFETRFNTECRMVLAFVSIVAYDPWKKLSLDCLFAGALLFEVMLGISMWTSVPFILAFTAVYAASGGLKAVMYTDVGQATIFILGGVVGMVFSFGQIGGFSGLVDTLEVNGLSQMMRTIRPISDPQYPVTGMLLSQPLCSCWYWCGCLLAGYLKILPPFLMVFPGLIARAFYEDTAKMFPDGLRGLLIVSMVLAMMSSLDSVFNCLSTIFTYDIYQRFLNPSASQRRQIWVGRLVTFGAACCGFAWLPMIASSADGLYLTTQSAQTHMAPTLVAVFLVGLFWPRANGAGALAGMTVGFTAGIARFTATKLVLCKPEDVWSIACMNFNHMGLILLVLTGFTTVAVSLVTKAPEAKCLEPRIARASWVSRVPQIYALLSVSSGHQDGTTWWTSRTPKDLESKAGDCWGLRQKRQIQSTRRDERWHSCPKCRLVQLG